MLLGSFKYFLIVFLESFSLDCVRYLNHFPRNYNLFSLPKLIQILKVFSMYTVCGLEMFIWNKLSIIYRCLNQFGNACNSFEIFPLFSSPEPKAQVSFSDQNLSVVRRCSSCCWHCRKLFTFSSSSPEALGQFQPNLAQSILGWRLDYSNEGPFIFPWGDNYEC